MFKKILVYIIICFAIFSVQIIIYANTVQNDISENVLRLHVVANSDSADDQAVKLKVRDAILSAMQKENFKTKEESYEYLYNNMKEVEDIARQVLVENGYFYGISVSLEECLFPQKTYGNIALPSGKYMALKVVLGDGVGQNWWCVMFPPLCFSDMSSGIVLEDDSINLQESLSEESFKVISDSASFRFKIVDCFGL